MKISGLLLFLSIIAIISCQTQPGGYDHYAMMEGYLNKDDAMFMASFPDDTGSFNKSFAYKRDGSLYHQSDEYIERFCILGGQTAFQEEAFRKMINIISQFTKWEADGPNHFRHCAYRRILAAPDEFRQIFKSYPKEQRTQFWHQLFEGPHPRHMDVEELQKKFFHDKEIYLELFPVLREHLRNSAEPHH